MEKNGSPRLFPALVAALLAVTLLAAGGAAWLRWGVTRPLPDTEPVAAVTTPAAAPELPTAPPTAAPPTAAPPTSTPALLTPTATPTQTATLAPTEYTVQDGDTLGAIAALFGVSVDELVELNGLDDPNAIVAGATLRLPGDQPADEPTVTPAAIGSERPATRQSPSATSAAAPLATLEGTIGASYGGRPIEHYVFGDGPAHVAFVGAIHGGYEWNTANLAYEMVSYFERNPAEVPDEVTLHIVPVANPDGMARVADGWQTGPIPAPGGVISDTYSGRFNDRDVDLNRNWDCNWQPTGVWRDTVVDAGMGPFSEPETLALRDLFLNTPMQAVVLWHSAAGVVLPGACRPATTHEPSLELAEVYSGASEYPIQSGLTYEINGDASDWLTTQGIPSIAIELNNHSAMDWEQNLAGTRAVLGYYARLCVANACGASDR